MARATFAAMAGAAITLQGCDLASIMGGITPPRGCFQLQFQNGELPMTDLNETVSKETICDEGYVWDGPPLMCGWVNRECKAGEDKDDKDVKDGKNRRMKDDKDVKDGKEEEENPNDLGGRNPQCQEVFGFLHPGDGLEEWPEGHLTVAVDKFSNNWEDFLKAAAKKAGKSAKASASSATAKASSLANGAAEKAKSAASSASEKAKAFGDKAKAAADGAAEKAKSAASSASENAKAIGDKAKAAAAGGKAEAETAATKPARRLADLPAPTAADDLKGKCVKKAPKEDGDAEKPLEKKFLSGPIVRGVPAAPAAALFALAAAVASMAVLVYRRAAPARQAALADAREEDEPAE